MENHDWSILIGKCSYEPLLYEIKHMFNNGLITRRDIIEEDLNKEFSENENDFDYFYVYFYIDCHDSFSHSTFNLIDKEHFKGFEIINIDNEYYIRKIYKEIEILKTILTDLCYFYNYFSTDIYEKYQIKLKKGINKEQQFKYFYSVKDMYTKELFFKLYH
jgi:hypothetical protein